MTRRSTVAMPDVAGGSRAVEAWAPKPISGDLSRDEAQRLTDDIRNHAAAAWTLLIRARQGNAWKALGYESWADYVGTEFGISRGRSYQLLDQARVIVAIEEAVSTKVDISEREARDIKPILPAVVSAVESAVEQLPPDATDDDKREVVKEQIAAARPVVSIKTKTTEEVTETYDAQTGEVVEPDPIAAHLASDEKLARVQYDRAFHKAVKDAGKVLLFDAERVALVADAHTIRALEDHVAMATKFLAKVRTSRSGLRLIEGGKK